MYGNISQASWLVKSFQITPSCCLSFTSDVVRAADTRGTREMWKRKISPGQAKGPDSECTEVSSASGAGIGSVLGITTGKYFH